MAGTIKPSEARMRVPEFFEGRSPDANWTLRVLTEGGKTRKRALTFVGEDWEAFSRFGKVASEVVVDENGRPLFDRPVYYEQPCVNVVAWGRDARTGEVKIAIITERRPHVNHPTLPDSTVPLAFAQIPMGFMERLVGKAGLSELEIAKSAGARETSEETGATIIRGFSRPACPWHNYSPSFMATWADLIFIEVDLEFIQERKPDGDELILHAEYLPVRELLARIREGQGKDGAIFRGCSSLSALMIFFSYYPEFWPR
jgi:hypothetical protein